MSRIGKIPINIPEGVNVLQTDNKLTVTGPKGELTLKLLSGFKLEQKEQRLELTVLTQTPNIQKQYGLMRTLIANAVTGVHQGFEKKLEIHGVGYRANMKGNTIVLSIGYSHPIEFTAPEGITITVEQNNIIVTGFDKQKVGEVSAQIRSFKKPEPYKGKGIKYQNEVIRRKAGKAAVKAGA